MLKEKAMYLPVMAGGVATVTAIPVFAADGDGSMTTITTALTTGFTTMVSDALKAIGQILPVVIPVFAAIIVIGISRRIVTKFTGR